MIGPLDATLIARCLLDNSNFHLTQDPSHRNTVTIGEAYFSRERDRSRDLGFFLDFRLFVLHYAFLFWPLFHLPFAPLSVAMKKTTHRDSGVQDNRPFSGPQLSVAGTSSSKVEVPSADAVKILLQRFPDEFQRLVKSAMGTTTVSTETTTEHTDAEGESSDGEIETVGASTVTCQLNNWALQRVTLVVAV